jgi:hypothetical protein
MVSIPANHPIRNDLRFNNCVNENVILHARNLCDFCTSPNPNDIKPSDLFDNYEKDPKYRLLRRLVRRVQQKYRKRGKGSVKLAHPTKTRSTRFDYTRHLQRVRPALEDLIAEIERIRGRRFIG